MSVIIFIIILGVLIFVHELGHFTVAKKSGIRVDEFAIGFPPRIYSFVKNGTRYALNLIPFGGYVKIFGENPDEESLDPNNKDSFLNKPKYIQAAVLVAGVAFNVIFAWILLSISLMSGFPQIVTDDNKDDVRDVSVLVTQVFEDSPAKSAGLAPGDTIVSISNGEVSYRGKEITVENIQNTIKEADGDVGIEIIRGGENIDLAIKPESGIIGDQQALGISLDRIGRVSLPVHMAFVKGLLMTGTVTKEIFVGLISFFGLIFSGNASLDAVSGPVGIVGLVGTAANFGFIYLLGFTAFISINLAVLNIFPFPALDGGRLVMVLIESITRKPIKPSIANAINAIGFMILILLMIVITISDVIKLF